MSDTATALFLATGWVSRRSILQVADLNLPLAERSHHRSYYIYHNLNSIHNPLGLNHRLPFFKEQRPFLLT